MRAGACDSSITYIDGKKGVLLYRGWAGSSPNCFMSPKKNGCRRFRVCLHVAGTTSSSWRSRATSWTAHTCSFMMSSPMQRRRRPANGRSPCTRSCMSSSSSSTRASSMTRTPWPSWCASSGCTRCCSKHAAHVNKRALLCVGGAPNWLFGSHTFKLVMIQSPTQVFCLCLRVISGSGGCCRSALSAFEPATRQTYADALPRACAHACA